MQKWQLELPKSYTLFSLLAVGFFVRIVRPLDRRHIFCLVGLALAFFSKEPAIALVALLPLIQLSFKRPRELQTEHTLSLYLPLLASAAFFLLVRAHVVGSPTVFPYWGGSFWSTIQMQAKVSVIYISLLV